MIDTPYQFKSLASRVRGMHGVLDADELAKLLGVAKVTILRRAKRGKIPSFRIGTMVRFDPQAILSLAARTRCAVFVHSESGYGTVAECTLWKSD